MLEKVLYVKTINIIKTTEQQGKEGERGIKKGYIENRIIMPDRYTPLMTNVVDVKNIEIMK